MNITEDDEVRKILENAIPKASKIYLWYYTHSRKNQYEEQYPLSKLIHEALLKIPSSGNIRYKKHTYAFRSIEAIFGELPKDDPLLPEIEKLLREKATWYLKVRS